MSLCFLSKYDEMPYKKDGLIVQDVIQLNHVDAKGVIVFMRMFKK